MKNDNAIAVVGMACRFPGSPDIDAYWKNLSDGRCCVSEFENGPSNRNNPSGNYVPVAGVLQDIDQFDADFFDVSPMEAEWMDPQHRLLMEEVWTALESSGHTDGDSLETAGVFAGLSVNTYLTQYLMPMSGGVLSDAVDLNVLFSNEKDFAATRIAHRLNMCGPVMAVQTACSTGLVVVHQAIQSLLMGECNMAVAAASSVRVPHENGYVYREGSILSRTGQCRAFDKDADGCIPGSGVAAVVLKRLDDAIEDGDTIHAVILGSAVNNDGNRKIGYAAPSVQGQAEVIRMAQDVAGVAPSDVSYVEMHGTGTKIGDPVEFSALKLAFDGGKDMSQTCWVGSVKPNIGHLDVAAGLAGLIKVALSLQNKKIPPSINFSEINPEIDIEQTGFSINDKLRRWKPENDNFVAGVSSFGVGGTNAHVILAAAPKAVRGKSDDDKIFAFPFSAPSEERLLDTLGVVAEYLEEHPNVAICDIANTLQNGRRHQSCRMVILSDSCDGLLSQIRNLLATRGTANLDGKLFGAEDDLLFKLWLKGDNSAWNEVQQDDAAKRISIPGTVFHRKKYWKQFSAPVSSGNTVVEVLVQDVDKRRYYAPRWVPVAAHEISQQKDHAEEDIWVVFSERENEKDFSDLLSNLSARNRLMIFPAAEFNDGDACWTIRSGEYEDYQKIANFLKDGSYKNIRIVHAWSARSYSHASGTDRQSFDQDKKMGFDSLINLVKAINDADGGSRVHIDLVSRNRFMVTPDDVVSPGREALSGIDLVVGQEIPWISCRSIDLDRGRVSENDALMEEFSIQRTGAYAFRGKKKWQRVIGEVLSDNVVQGDALRSRAAYVIFGGFGGIGHVISKFLVEKYQAKLLLVDRKKSASEYLPVKKDQWGNHLRVLGGLMNDGQRPKLIHDDAELVRDLNALCRIYVMEYFGRVGIQFEAGQTFSFKEVLDKTRSVKELTRLIEFMLRCLVEDGIVEEKSAGKYKWVSAPDEQAEDIIHKVKGRYDDLGGLLDFLKHCVDQYERAISGDIPPISVLYPEGRQDLILAAAQSMLARSTGTKCNKAFAAWLAEYAKASAGSLVRVLEFGAGNLLLTREVMTKFAEEGVDNVEYWVTDLGGGFVNKGKLLAEEMGWTGIKFKVLDISADPKAQGVPENYFDVAVGLNVVHATKNIGETFSQVQKSLSPAGNFAFIESIRHERWVDMVAGLAEGWWYFDDPYRVTSPLLDVSSWLQALEDHGFDAEAFPSDDVERNTVDCALFFAKDNRKDRQNEGVSPKAVSMMEKLTEMGGDVRVISADVAEIDDVREVLRYAQQEFGEVNGIISTAGEISGALISNLSEADIEKEFRARVLGGLNIVEASQDTDLDFIALSSSLNTLVGGEGQAAYVAANAVVSGIAEADRKKRTVSLLWDRWKDVGLAKNFQATYRSITGKDIEGGMSEEEGFESFCKILGSGYPQVAMSDEPLEKKFERYIQKPKVGDSGHKDAVERAEGLVLTEEVLWLANEIVSIASDKLGIEEIVPSDKLMDLGVDSIVILDFQMALESALGLRISVASLMSMKVEQIANSCVDYKNNPAMVQVLDIEAFESLMKTARGGQ